MTLTVVTAAASSDLTTLENVKADLEISDNDSDAWLERQITVASSLVVGGYGLDVPETVSGTRNCGRETVLETFRLDRGHPYQSRCDVRRREIGLARWRGNPVIVSVVENGVTLAADEYELSEGGILLRLSSGYPSLWGKSLVKVTLTSGWFLPGDDGRDLPLDIEEACIELVRAAHFSRGRDPNLKRERNEGVADFMYFDPTPDGQLPASVVLKLRNWRY